MWRGKATPLKTANPVYVLTAHLSSGKEATSTTPTKIKSNFSVSQNSVPHSVPRETSAYS